MSPLSESNWDHKNAPDSENPDIEAFSPIRNKVKWPNWDRKTESYPSRQQNTFNILLKRYCLHNYYQCSLMKVTESEKNACKNTREREKERESYARPADRLRKDVKKFNAQSLYNIQIKIALPHD